MTSHLRSSGRRRLAALVAPTVAVAAVLVGAVAIDGTTATAAQPEIACPDVTLVLANGSGESVTQYGRLMSAVKTSFEATLTDGWTRTVELLPYESAGVEELLAGPPGIGRYLDSMTHGVQNLQQLVESKARACPQEQFALAGYSQGAIVVHRAMDEWATTNPAMIDRVDGVALIADGARLAGDVLNDMGSAPARDGIWSVANALGTWPFGSPRPASPAMRSRTMSVCDTGDIVCDPAGTFTACNPVELSCWEPQAARLKRQLEHGFDVHTTHYQAQAERVGRNLANMAMAHPTPAPAVQTIGAVQGVMLRAALTFKNPRPRGTVSVVGPTPDWLTVNAQLAPGKVTLVGRPPAVGLWNVRLRITDSPGRYGPVEVPVVITATPPQISPSSLPHAVMGQDYVQQLAADIGGTPTWTASTGLPTGITLSSTGLLSGRPPTVGTSTFEVTAKAGRRQVSAIYTLVVDAVASIGHPTAGPWLTTWSATFPDQIPLPPLKDAPVESIATAGESISVLYADGTGQRWSWLSGMWQGGDVPASDITRLSAGGAYITDGLAVHDWRMYCCEALGPQHLAFGESRYVDVVGSRTQALALTDQGRVIAGDVPFGGLATAPDWVPQELNGVKVTAIEANLGADFAVTEGGDVVHWSNTPRPLLDSPQGLCPVSRVRFNAVVIGICAADGSVRAWGEVLPGDSRLSVPAGLTGVKDVAIGFDYVLALRTDGSVVVWGDGAATVPSVRSGVFAIGAGLVGAIGQ